MLRSLLVGLLVVTGAAACSGGGGDAPAVDPGKTVGKVVEITGKVTATRGTVTRDLDASSTVSGDDVITTAGDGRITILLAHNNATWDLGPNKHEQVSTSMAWKLAKVDAPAGAVDETSTAAGRHAERSAASGGAAQPERAPATAPAPGGPPPTGGGGEAGPDAVAQPAPVTGKGADAPPRPRASPKAIIVPAEPRKEPAPDRVDAIGGAAAKAKLETAKVDVDAKQERQDRKTAGDDEAGNPLAAAIEKERPALRACVAKSGKDKLAIKVHFAKGAATITLAEGSAADKACVAQVAARIKLTVDSADYAAVIAK